MNYISILIGLCLFQVSAYFNYPDSYILGNSQDYLKGQGKVLCTYPKAPFSVFASCGLRFQNSFYSPVRSSSDIVDFYLSLAKLDVLLTPKLKSLSYMGNIDVGS